jgi:RNA polymerase sigma-70 factor (ECF subfamily)
VDLSDLLDQPQRSGTVPDLPLDSVEHPPLARAPNAVEPLGEWLALAAAQESKALRKLHDATTRRLHAVVSRIISDPHLADEVVNECFWQVWREAARFDLARGSVATWMTTIARSRALDAMRRRKALARHEEALTDEHEESWTRDDESPVARLQRAQRDQGLSDALARLDPIQRQLVSLAFIGGLSHEQVAEHCGMALGTVKSHIRRGLSRMRLHCMRAGLCP